MGIHHHRKTALIVGPALGMPADHQLPLHGVVGALKLRAAIKIDKGQIDSAVSDLREALNDQPKSSELLILLAVAYEKGGKNELADRQYADAQVRFENFNDECINKSGFSNTGRAGDADQMRAATVRK